MAWQTILSVVVGVPVWVHFIGRPFWDAFTAWRKLSTSYGQKMPEHNVWVGRQQRISLVHRQSSKFKQLFSGASFRGGAAGIGACNAGLIVRRTGNKKKALVIPWGELHPPRLRTKYMVSVTTAQQPEIEIIFLKKSAAKLAPYDLGYFATVV